MVLLAAVNRASKDTECSSHSLGAKFVSAKQDRGS